MVQNAEPGVNPLCEILRAPLCDSEEPHRDSNAFPLGGTNYEAKSAGTGWNCFRIEAYVLKTFLYLHPYL